MKERNFSNVRFSLAMTAVALGGALAMASCAGNGTTSGAGGSGQTGQGGTSGGNGGSTTNPGGNGGSTGTSSGACTPAADSVCFSGGQASGVMSGYGWIALGPQDSATSPVCAPDPTNLTTTQTISSATPCPQTGSTVWSTVNPNALCISGTIPIVTDDTAFPSGDYNADWGLQIGVNSSAPPVDYNGGGTTLGRTYSTITLNTTGTITPTNGGIRAEIHTSTQGTSTTNYCAAMTSGRAITLTDFNTKCYDSPADGTALTAADVPNIDKIGVQISSDIGSAYTVTNFCLTGVTFGN